MIKQIFADEFTQYLEQKKLYILVLWTVIGGREGYHGRVLLCLVGVALKGVSWAARCLDKP